MKSKWKKKYNLSKLLNKKRLMLIAGIIERVDTRCMVADRPVTKTLDEMTQEEISEIYFLSCGK